MHILNLTVLPAVLLSGYIMHSCYIVVNLIHVVNVFVLSTQPQVATFVVNLPKKKRMFSELFSTVAPEGIIIISSREVKSMNFFNCI